MIKTLSLAVVSLTALLILAGVTLVDSYSKQATGYFRHVPSEDVHTMRVWEDGSFEIVYKNNTSEVGCLPTGLCQK